MAAYEMNAFGDSYHESHVRKIAKYFAKCLKQQGLDVAGDPAVGWTIPGTRTRSLVSGADDGSGPEVAESY